MTKLPPPEKIYEAYSAVADGRVAMRDGSATVTSSNGEKTYSVSWDGDEYASDDNATRWQGYPGYPVLAVLMLQGRLPYRPETAALFAGIDWTSLNARHKRNYAAAVAEVMRSLADAGRDTDVVAREAKAAHEALAAMELTVKRGASRKKTS